jgi:hypothetical protein
MQAAQSPDSTGIVYRPAGSLVQTLPARQKFPLLSSTPTVAAEFGYRYQQADFDRFPLPLSL